MKNFTNTFYKADDAQIGNPPAAEPNTPDSGLTIPKARFDEVNQRAKDLEARLNKIETERNTETENRLIEQEEWKVLAEERLAKLAEAERKAAKADLYEKNAAERYEKLLEELPETMQKVIPQKYSVVDKLAWIDENRELFMKPAAPKINGEKGAGGSTSEALDLTDEDRAAAKKLKMSEEDYAKYNY